MLEVRSIQIKGQPGVDHVCWKLMIWNTNVYIANIAVYTTFRIWFITFSKIAFIIAIHYFTPQNFAYGLYFGKSCRVLVQVALTLFFKVTSS